MDLSPSHHLHHLNPKPNHFKVPLGIACLTIIFTIVSPDIPISRQVAILLLAASLILTFQATEMVSSKRHLALALIVVATALSSYGIAANDDAVHGAGHLLAAILIVWAAAMVIRWIAAQAQQRITMQAVVGGVLVYLLIGISFSQLYGATIDFNPSVQFFCTQPSISPSDRMYFSFSTITTTGFGDFVPCTNVGHAMAVAEAAFGQIYLVTIIALLVGNIGRGRRHLTGDENADEPAPADTTR